MGKFLRNKNKLKEKGFSVTGSIFSEKELNTLIEYIEGNSTDFSIRQLVNKIPEVQEIIFNNTMFKELFLSVCGEDYFLSKGIYFNKQKGTNWFVSYHQDISISVKERVEVEGYTNWTLKKNQLGVIPPKNILDGMVTFRIHLDEVDDTNGALRVIEKSHKKGIIRVDENFNKSTYGNEVICEVEKGGVMLMKPLLLHASNKSISESDRRVIHLEFSNQEIPMGWLEKKIIS
ncbi:phytanoyl-CoA dioxygenase family protein [Flavobacteriaceae bacterium S356]|uniref:Phytanoyl-CoA dioxygenase family protein n=1 Tax=Asprobacillus argus TaxID=3076534 RepID=A0ABU3LHY2_9FLAO|nr:phytanoyl-CoA dioxygenase family protein [Flavobacteriaceae bacterium S356]